MTNLILALVSALVYIVLALTLPALGVRIGKRFVFDKPDREDVRLVMGLCWAWPVVIPVTLVGLTGMGAVHLFGKGYSKYVDLLSDETKEQEIKRIQARRDYY